MTADSHTTSARSRAGRVDLDEFFRDAPVLTSRHGLAAPEVFPDDTEFQEFLTSYRADRQRDIA